MMAHTVKFFPITYRIAIATGLLEPFYAYPKVNGYAIQLPPPFERLRFCVRRCDDRWVVDHYDTGYAVNGPVAAPGASAKAIRRARRWANPGSSREVAARWLLRYLRHLQVRRHPTLLALIDQRRRVAPSATNGC